MAFKENNMTNGSTATTESICIEIPSKLRITVPVGSNEQKIDKAKHIFKEILDSQESLSEGSKSFLEKMIESEERYRYSFLRFTIIFAVITAVVFSLYTYFNCDKYPGILETIAWSGILAFPWLIITCFSAHIASKHHRNVTRYRMKWFCRNMPKDKIPANGNNQNESDKSSNSQCEPNNQQTLPCAPPPSCSQDDQENNSSTP